MSERSSEPFGAQQREQQIGAERECDDETEDGFDHDALRYKRFTAMA
jgi:hypothetical protein